MKDCLKLNIKPYPGVLYLVTSKKCLPKVCKMLGLPADLWKHDGWCGCDTSTLAIILAVDAHNTSLSLVDGLSIVVHELQHAWEHILEFSGEKSDLNGEHKAYMMQHLSQQCFEFFLKQRGVK